MMVQVDEPGFRAILARIEQPLILLAPPEPRARQMRRYAVSCQGFVFYLDSKKPVEFGCVPVVTVKSIDWMASLHD